MASAAEHRADDRQDPERPLGARRHAELHGLPAGDAPQQHRVGHVPRGVGLAVRMVQELAGVDPGAVRPTPHLNW